ncbi:LamG domain-containing protein [Flagellimonas sp. HMM57]|uniref:LamG domain-containing protein n=1 Tax=unclassified Flagellimonas TaxID=2644544 RepID=UPI0013D5EBE2|nr:MULTISPECIES: LamG domain-containing protein [unclassified Flagellimonas]UII74749.1 LamG domain-containing protein [Flagellimonas sp. HMM57]
MKNKITKITAGCLTLALFLFVAISCNDDDDTTGGGNFNIAAVEASIAEARTLISNTEEGINAGDQQPGSKAILETIIAAVEKIIASSDSQADVDDAVIKMNAGIQAYRESLVAVAIPYIRQEAGSSIGISENLNTFISEGNFTLQAQFYIVDLNANSFSSNLFAKIDQPGNGFQLRYFIDGNAQLVVGNTQTAGTFTVIEIPAGTFTSGEWIDVAVTSSNGGSLVTAYVNGVQVAQAGDRAIGNTDIPLTIGTNPGFPERVANLLVREFTVWDAALDQAAIQTNATAEFDGTEDGLEAYFPFGSDLGDSFVDVTGVYTATLNGNVEWVAEPPFIVLDYSALDAAISDLTAFKDTIVEGDQNGDYPIGTIAYLDGLIAAGSAARTDAERQSDIDAAAAALDVVALVNDNLVGGANGFYVDDQDDSMQGFRITPYYVPQGDYTFEFEMRLTDLFYPGGIGDALELNVLGFRVNGYTELTEENLLNSGGGWNYTFNLDDGFTGPTFPALTLQPEQWLQITIVHDDAAQTTAVYVDGEQVGLQENIPAPSDCCPVDQIYLGANRFGQKIDGSMRDFRLWDLALTPAQFNADIDGSEAGLQIYFPLDRVNGIKFKDETGNYDGELQGVIWNKEE